MKAKLFINGFFVGELTYEHPKGSDGKPVVLPSPEGGDVLSVIIRDDDNRLWHNTGKVERIS